MADTPKPPPEILHENEPPPAKEPKLKKREKGIYKLGWGSGASIYVRRDGR